MADGSVVAKNRSNVLGSKGTLLLNSLLTKMGGRDEMIKASVNLQETKRKIYLKAKSSKDMERHGFGWNRWSRAWFKVIPSLKALPIR